MSWQPSPSQQSISLMAPISLCVAPIVVSKGSVKCIPVLLLCKHVLAAANTNNNRRIVGRFMFYAVRVVSKKVGDSFFPELVLKK
jgi:hypothetical protein